MKRITVVCLILALLFLVSCGGPKDPLSGSVRIKGEINEAETVTAEVKSNANDSELIYTWYANGVKIGDGKEFTLPEKVAGKKLTVEVASSKREGKIVSDAAEIGYKIPKKTYKMAELLPKVKWSGRSVETDDGAVSCEWAASGFEMRVKTDGGAFLVNYDTGYQVCFAVIVDGMHVLRPECEKGKGSFSVWLKSGEHNVKVLREHTVDTGGARCYIASVGFDGEILERPADSDLYIEFIGASVTSGSLALIDYDPNVVGDYKTHTATHSFAYVAAQTLGADYSMVCKGGIGLIQKSGKYNMTDIYDYVNGYADHGTLYDISKRKPDIIVFQLGGNDGSLNTTDEEIKKAYADFIDFLRQRYGSETPIVWTEKNEQVYNAMKQIVAERAGTDNRLYNFYYKYGSSGGAGAKGSKMGHPNVEEQEEFGKALAEYLKKTVLG